MGAPPVLSVGLAVAVGWAPRWSTPIDAVGLPSAADCAGCHPEQAARWADSGHRSAWTSPLFAAGFAAEPQPWCASCHAPLPEMRAEVVANLPWYARQDPRRLRFGPAPTRLPEPRAAEGVTCVACHAPDGGPIRGTRGDVDWAAHEVVRDPGLTDGTACRGCHEFPMPRFVGSVAAFTDQPMQSTASEWDRYRAAGGEGTCASCHLPGGDHTVRGTADRAWLRASVAIDVARDGAGARFTVRSVGVGHALPSGDLFRRLTLDVDRGEGFVTAATFGRSFALDGEVKVQRADTSLQPGEPRQVTVDAVPPGARWRLRWHDGAVHDEQRGWVDPETIVADLATGAL